MEKVDRSVFSRLRKTDTALAGKKGNQPLILFRHGRWHMVTLGSVVDAAFEARQGIAGVHFMSPDRARRTIREWYPYSVLSPFDALCPGFRAELDAKVLPAAEDYRPLLHAGLAKPVGGFTTDTLATVEGDEDALIEMIGRWMEFGGQGPFLHFGRSYDVVQNSRMHR